ncbi:phage baseplate protein [Lactococcus petauri]|uniref:phage baseplate protein n=1 Tax=Lactococcus petauri TaxID=1940789 RepID=UPI0022DF1FC2|nr:phage baseplate protein [Lactococcus petauri]
MAIWTFPLKSINGSNMYSDKDFRRFYANIFSSGIIPNVDLEGNLSLQVLQTETPSMNIRVGPGVDMINGGHIMNTAIKEFPIPAPLTTQERIDCIVAQWNDSTNSGDIIYKKNTTQIVRSQDIWEHKLAEIVVPANATSISQANITDTRANPDVCGYSSPFEKIDVGDLAAQFKALTDEYNLEFQAWFENLKNQLDDNQAANLQNQIDTINGFIVQKNIPDGANLDEYKAEGEFSKKTPTIVVGAPEGVTGAFRLSVRTMLGSSGIFQTLYDYVTRSMYYRIGNTTLGFNIPWQKVKTDIDDIPWTTIPGSSNRADYKKEGNTVTIRWNFTSAGNYDIAMGTLPEGCRPKQRIFAVATLSSVNNIFHGIQINSATGAGPGSITLFKALQGNSFSGQYKFDID